MKKEATIVLLIFIALMLIMMVLGYIGYDRWTYEP